MQGYSKGSDSEAKSNVCLCCECVYWAPHRAGPQITCSFSGPAQTFSPLLCTPQTYLSSSETQTSNFWFQWSMLLASPSLWQAINLGSVFVQPRRVLSVAKLAGQRCVPTSAWNWASLLYSSFLNSLSVALPCLLQTIFLSWNGEKEKSGLRFIFLWRKRDNTNEMRSVRATRIHYWIFI